LKPQAPGQAKPFRFHLNGERLQRQLALLELPCYRPQTPLWQQKGKTNAALVGNEPGIRFGQEFLRQPLQQLNAHKWRVARQEQHRIFPSGFQSRVNATERTAAWYDVAPDDAHRQTTGSSCGPDLAKHSFSSKPEPGLVAPHSPAQPAGQNTNLKGLVSKISDKSATGYFQASLRDEVLWALD
jgi:hypothetical protein